MDDAPFVYQASIRIKAQRKLVFFWLYALTFHLLKRVGVHSFFCLIRRCAGYSYLANAVTNGVEFIRSSL